MINRLASELFEGSITDILTQKAKKKLISLFVKPHKAVTLQYRLFFCF